MNKKILKLIEQRLEKGEKSYGKENISSDGRDFVQESLEEALDCAVYLAGHIIELQDWQNKNKEWDKILPDYQRTGDECI
jgi:NAD dependent epimerase/dehydratase family enzyme